MDEARQLVAAGTAERHLGSAWAGEKRPALGMAHIGFRRHGGRPTALHCAQAREIVNAKLRAFYELDYFFHPLFAGIKAFQGNARLQTKIEDAEDQRP
ncbi:MAG TPA: hypothetical protein VN231_01405 [Allosphingosinicella sp.]|nr:hypothetical protein [Allosphingosinicella sp.]